jgi:hypothetical protein
MSQPKTSQMSQPKIGHAWPSARFGSLVLQARLPGYHLLRIELSSPTRSALSTGSKIHGGGGGKRCGNPSTKSPRKLCYSMEAVVHHAQALPGLAVYSVALGSPGLCQRMLPSKRVVTILMGF